MDAKKRPQDDALKSAPIPEEKAGNADEEAGSTARDMTGVDPQDPIIRPEDERSG